jgi:hypothetical protein
MFTVCFGEKKFFGNNKKLILGRRLFLQEPFVTLFDKTNLNIG